MEDEAAFNRQTGTESAGRGTGSAAGDGSLPGWILREIPVERLTPDPFQPRKEFDEAAIRELADSIAAHGILQPLLVRPMQGPSSRDRYWIVAGERRYRAAKLLGLRALPCTLRPYENAAAAVIALAENIHREDLGELEKAEALQRIKIMTERTWDQVADLVRLSRDYVKRLVGLLKLEESVKEQVRSGRISARTAIALRPLPPLQQIEMAERVLREGLTAEQIREEARRTARPRTRRGSKPAQAFLPTRSGSKSGSVVARLHEAAGAVAQIEAWLQERQWTPSEVSEPQRKALEALYQQVSLLQQYLIYTRTALRDAEQPEAEKLRKAGPLPF